jgi:hypothetical protein
MNVNDGRIAKEVMDIRGVAAYLGLGKSKDLRFDPRTENSRRRGSAVNTGFPKELIDAWLRDSVITRPDGDPPAAEEGALHVVGNGRDRRPTVMEIPTDGAPPLLFFSQMLKSFS